jgi:hypothetical protein
MRGLFFRGVRRTAAVVRNRAPPIHRALLEVLWVRAAYQRFVMKQYVVVQPNRPRGRQRSGRGVLTRPKTVDTYVALIDAIGRWKFGRRIDG